MLLSQMSRQGLLFSIAKKQFKGWILEVSTTINNVEKVGKH